jgi:molybdopterin-binding protein
VVAAVTAATKVAEAPVVPGSVATAGQDPGPVSVDGPSGEVPAVVTNPTAVQKEGVPDGSEVIAADKENEVQGASKKKKEDKAGCFRCKKPGHYIDDCPHHTVIYVSPSIMSLPLVICLMPQNQQLFYMVMLMRH